MTDGQLLEHYVRSREEAAFAALVPEQLCRLLVTLSLDHLVDLRLQVAVAGQEIKATVQVVVQKENAELEQRPAGTVDSLGHGIIRK